VLLVSSLENPIASELGAAIHLPVSFLSYNRLILDRNYAGYRGWLALMEDTSEQIMRPAFSFFGIWEGRSGKSPSFRAG